MRVATANYQRMNELAQEDVTPAQFELEVQPGIEQYLKLREDWRVMEGFIELNGWDVFKYCLQPDTCNLKLLLRVRRVVLALATAAKIPDTNAEYPYVSITARSTVWLVESKGKTYGDSWKSRGGVGAFMMLARKWDRIANMLSQESDSGDWLRFNRLLRGCGALEDLIDLYGYLLLVHDEVVRLVTLGRGDPADAEPKPHGYVDQG